jgi:hypothetical protein
MSMNFYEWCTKQGDYGKTLIDQWTGIEVDKKTHEEINHNVDIKNVTIGMARKFKFICNKGHEYIKDPRHLVYKKQLCPYCNITNTSYPEQFLYWSLKQICPNAENRCKVLKSSKYPNGIEFDIGIPSIPLCIEYSPTRWHNGKERIDENKRRICKEYNVDLIEIIEDTYDELEHGFSNNRICFKIKNKNPEQDLISIVVFICNLYRLNWRNIDFKKSEELANHYNTNANVPYEKSFEYNYPNLANEWNAALNVLKPSEISKGRNLKVYWVCEKCGYGANSEWDAYTQDRVHKVICCPYCGWFSGDKSQHKSNGRLIKGFNDLESVFPELAKEWNVELNDGVTPDSFKPHSHRIGLWTCQKCGFGSRGEWIAKVYSRTNKRGCPRCGYKWFKDNN